MTLSLIFTINNRSPEACQAVADSFRLPGNAPDEAVIVLDRPEPESRRAVLKAWADPPCPVKWVEITGPPGWICPAKAWNAGYEAASGELFYQISSEVVQDAGNVQKARLLAAGGRCAVFGSCHNSEPTQMVVGAEPGLLASSRLPRPLGFIVCYPAWAMRQIGGNDLAFMEGLWYEDDDLFFRFWKTGVDFLFADSIHGIHLDHARPGLATPEGEAKMAINRALMLRKHGTTNPLSALSRITRWQDGNLLWMHPRDAD